MSPEPATFGGEEHFAASPAAVIALLTDLDRMAATIPDVVSSERVDAQTLKCVVRPGFSFIRGTMRMTIALGEPAGDEQASMKVSAQGIGMAMDVGSQLQVHAEGDGSRLEWTAQIEKRSGLISAVSPSLIKAAADQVIRHAWSQVRKQLGEEQVS